MAWYGKSLIVSTVYCFIPLSISAAAIDLWMCLIAEGAKKSVTDHDLWTCTHVCYDNQRPHTQRKSRTSQSNPPHCHQTGVYRSKHAVWRVREYPIEPTLCSALSSSFSPPNKSSFCVGFLFFSVVSQMIDLVPRRRRSPEHSNFKTWNPNLTILSNFKF